MPTSLRALSAILGYSKSTLQRAGAPRGARVLGLDDKHYPPNRAEQDELVYVALTALLAGRSVAEVAAACGVSPRTVRRWRLDAIREADTRRSGVEMASDERRAH